MAIKHVLLTKQSHSEHIGSLNTAISMIEDQIRQDYGTLNGVYVPQLNVLKSLRDRMLIEHDVCHCDRYLD